MSADTHRHCYVVVVPELGSPHGDSVPWSIPLRGFYLSSVQMHATWINMGPHLPSSSFNECPQVSPSSSCFFLSEFLLSTLPQFLSVLSLPPPSLDLLKSSPPCKSWTPSPHLTLPHWLIAQVSSQRKMPTILGKAELCFKQGEWVCTATGATYMKPQKKKYSKSSYIILFSQCFFRLAKILHITTRNEIRCCWKLKYSFTKLWICNLIWIDTATEHCPRTTLQSVVEIGWNKIKDTFVGHLGCCLSCM